MALPSKFVQHYMANVILVQYLIASHAEVWTSQFWWKFYQELIVTIVQGSANSRPTLQGFLQQFREKAHGQNWKKMIDLTLKLGEIHDIEHNKGSKIYPQYQVIF